MSDGPREVPGYEAAANEVGATTVEYALILVVAATTLVGLGTLSQAVTRLYAWAVGAFG